MAKEARAPSISAESDKVSLKLHAPEDAAINARIAWEAGKSKASLSRGWGKEVADIMKPPRRIEGR